MSCLVTSKELHQGQVFEGFPVQQGNFHHGLFSRVTENKVKPVVEILKTFHAQIHTPTVQATSKKLLAS